MFGHLVSSEEIAESHQTAPAPIAWPVYLGITCFAICFAAYAWAIFAW